MVFARNLILILSSSFFFSAQLNAYAQDAVPDAQNAATAAPQSEQEFLQTTDEKWRKMINDGQEMFTAGKATAALSMWKRALSQVQRTKTEDEKLKNRMSAIANKKLGEAYTASGDYVKADASLKDAKTTYEKLGIPDAELEQARASLESHYKTIDFPVLGDKVEGYLKEAGVSKIVVFRKEDRDLVQIDLAQKYVKPVESKDVPKVSFNKKISFEFFSKPNGDYQVSKIQGLQVFAKSLWVNLLESILKVGAGAGRSAEITAGKMGVTKTVVVDVPDDIYNTTKQILDNLIGAIKGQPAMAAQSQPVPSQSYGENTSSDNTTSGSSSTGFNNKTVPVETDAAGTGSYGNVPPQANSQDSPLEFLPGQRGDPSPPPSPDPQSYNE